MAAAAKKRKRRREEEGEEKGRRGTKSRAESEILIRCDEMKPIKKMKREFLIATGKMRAEDANADNWNEGSEYDRQYRREFPDVDILADGCSPKVKLGKRRTNDDGTGAERTEQIGMHAAANRLELKAVADRKRFYSGSKAETEENEVAREQIESSWRAYGIDQRFSKHLESLGFKSPTQVQRLSFSNILALKDVIMCAETGSGKTLAYAVPALQQLINLSLGKMNMEDGFVEDKEKQQTREPCRIRREDGCRILCLSPTRELCIQILSVFNALCRNMPWCVTGAVIGGEKRSSEKVRSEWIGMRKLRINNFIERKM